MSEDKTRLAKDSMGEFKVPENAMYGASTARAVENFQISDLRFKRSFIKVLGEIKRACAIANEKNKLLDKKIADQIVKSAELVSEGEFDDDFVVDLLLKDDNVISVYGGGSESGRRALGNRSILADPRNKNMKDIINEKVKHRQWFRPFAPSILREEVKNWFEKDIDSPYMSFVLKFIDKIRSHYIYPKFKYVIYVKLIIPSPINYAPYSLISFYLCL